VRASTTWSAPASEFPEFGGGTQIALISYEIENYSYLTHGAEKSFERILNTRQAGGRSISLAGQQIWTPCVTRLRVFSSTRECNYAFCFGRQKV
jgi:hypothetical protein